MLSLCLIGQLEIIKTHKTMKNSKKIYLLLFTALIFSMTTAVGQILPGATCATAAPFCGEIPSITFQAGVNSGSFGSGVACLGSTPNPAWYMLQVGQNGRINLHMTTNPSKDLDFACWGPFNDPADGCGILNTSSHSSHGPANGANPVNLGGYPFGNLVDCSYDPAHEEYVHIPNALTGQWYLLLITNFSNQPCNITFGTDFSSTGNTNCEILTPPPAGDTICEGETGSLKISNPIPGATYYWSGPGGLSLNTTNSTLSFPNARRDSVGGEWCVSVAFQGMTSNDEKCTWLEVRPRPTLIVTTDTICVGETGNLFVSGAKTYKWNTNETTPGISVTPSITTQYSVIGTTATFKSSLGPQWSCKSTALTQVVVADNPMPIITPAAICSNELATVTALDVVSYVWSDPALINDSVTPSVTASQTYTVTVTNTAGCIGSATLTVHPNPTVSATATDICQGQSSTVTATGATNYDWSNFQTGSVISVSPSSSLGLSVIGYTEFGCKGYDTTMVVVHPLPDAGFSLSSDLITIDDGILTIIDQSTGATGWHYNFGEYTNSTNTSSEQNPTHIYVSTGFFKIWQVVSTEFGCMDSTFKRVQVMAPYFFWVPGGFSPDNNGLNETFCPKGKGIDPNNYSMEIFDRWGSLVFRTTSPLDCWNGYINGTKAPFGNYIYKINLKDLEAHYHEYIGQLVIVR